MSYTVYLGWCADCGHGHPDHFDNCPRILTPTPIDPLPAHVRDTLAALSEAVTHAQDQLPKEVAQAWADAERLVWERLGAS